MAITFAELPKALNVLVYGQEVPDHGEALPEMAIILGCSAALDPDQDYVILDPESGEIIPGWVHSPAAIKIAEWSGESANSAGYGWVEQLATRYGAGLQVTLGGSVLQSASSFWIMPVALVGFCSDE